MQQGAQNKLAISLNLTSAHFPDTDDVREAIALVLISAAIEDGVLEDAELDIARIVMHDHPLWKGDIYRVHAFVDKALAIASGTADVDFDEAFNRALACFQTSQQRELVMAMVLAIVAADGDESAIEERLEDALLERFEITPQRRRELVEAVQGYLMVQRDIPTL